MKADFIMPRPSSTVSTKLDYIEIKFSGAVRHIFVTFWWINFFFKVKSVSLFCLFKKYNYSYVMTKEVSLVNLDAFRSYNG